MNRHLMGCVAAAVVGAATSGALGASSFGAAPFNGSSMLGWSNTSRPGVLAYAELPFHGAAGRSHGPRLGVAMTAPTASRIGAFRPITDAPRTVELRFSAADIRSPWAWSLRSDRAVAWSTDPSDVPGAKDRLFGGTGSWIAVGLLTAGAVAGTFLITEDDVPPPATAPR